MINTAGCPRNSNIRPMYCRTNYFSNSNPDPYTYLQYWRRRMAYNTYLQYNGVNNITNAPAGSKVYSRMVDYTAHSYN